MGDGENLTDMTFIDNAAWAHLDAEKALKDHTSPCAGKAYFIGQQEPVVLWSWLQSVLEGVGVAPIQKQVSRRTAYAVGAILEVLWRTLALPGEPRMTRFVAAQLASSHTYSMEPARRDFAYAEVVPLEEATRKTIAWLKESLAV